METDERDQIENTTTFNKIDTQDIIEKGNLVDTDTELQHDTVHDTEEVELKINKNLTTVIAENKKDDEVIDEKIILMLMKRQK